MPRVTATKTVERVERLQGLILEGQPNTVRLTFASKRGGSPESRAGLPAAEEGMGADKYDIDESDIDRQELFSWSIRTLMAAAGQAMQQKNPAQW